MCQSNTVPAHSSLPICPSPTSVATCDGPSLGQWISQPRSQSFRDRLGRTARLLQRPSRLAARRSSKVRGQSKVYGRFKGATSRHVQGHNLRHDQQLHTTIMAGSGRVPHRYDRHLALQSRYRSWLSGFDQNFRIQKFTHAFPTVFLQQSGLRHRVCTGEQSLAMPGMASSNTELPLTSCIGFNGSVDGGLVLEKDGTTVIYPLGSTIIVKQLHKDQQQMFLQGHTDEVRFISSSLNASSC